MDLVLSRVPISYLSIIDGYIGVASDHHPILSKLGTDIDRRMAPIRVSKTLLQSDRLKREVGIFYEVALNAPQTRLNDIAAQNITPQTNINVNHLHDALKEAIKAITDPGTSQSKRSRRGSGPHVNAELRRIWERKKILYDFMRRQPTTANQKIYREICALEHWR